MSNAKRSNIELPADLIKLKLLWLDGFPITSKLSLDIKPIDIFDHALKLDPSLLQKIEKIGRVVHFRLKEHLHLRDLFKSPYFCVTLKEGILEGEILQFETSETLEASEDRVLHYKKKKEFSLRLTPIKRLNYKHLFAVVQYEKVDSDCYELYHTEVPTRFRGKGFGKIVAKKSFSELLNEVPKLILSCSFLIDFYQKNKDDYCDYDITCK